MLRRLKLGVGEEEPETGRHVIIVAGLLAVVFGPKFHTPRVLEEKN